MVRASGILLHPSMLPSGYGVGDFGGEAREFVDFLVRSKQRYWQVLPLGPTTYGNSPYQSPSAFAGNFLFISPDSLAEAGLLTGNDLAGADFPCGRAEYEEAAVFKKSLLKKAFANFKHNKPLKTEFSEFCALPDNLWLDDYAFFMAVKEGLSGAARESWPEEFKDYNRAAAHRPRFAEAVEFEKFIQFIFFRQWQALKTYANENGIEIIGDLPIFVSGDSADVWAFPELFALGADFLPKAAAGVPPDYFSETGQLWGNPLYAWAAHAKTGYAWWKERLRRALGMFDIIRIDHFRGFEAYWEIPFGEENAVRGKWVAGPGKAFFDAMAEEFGRLPIIAEDLGIITEEVEELRDSLGFPGMKVLQYAFDSDPKNTNKPHNFKTSNCVVYSGTHDNDTSAGWYDSRDDETRDLFRRYMNTPAESPSWDLIRLAALSCADTAIYPIQDILGLGGEARFNKPGTLSDDNWRFRIKKGSLSRSLAGALAYLTELADRG